VSKTSVDFNMFNGSEEGFACDFLLGEVLLLAIVSRIQYGEWMRGSKHDYP
jgi:hypothetical protein